MPNRSAAPSSTIELVRGLQPTMPTAQQAVAGLVLEDAAAVASMTILELAERCGVSTGTITRFCRALGLNGYAPLRIALAADSGRATPGTWAANIGTDVAEGDDLRQVADVISGNIAHVVTEALANLALADVERAAALLTEAFRVVVYGVAGSGAAASEFQQRLYRIDVPAWSHSDAHVALTGAALMGPGDVVVAVSHSGRTREVCDVVSEAKSQRATAIAITNDLESPLARRADLVLATGVRQVGFRTETILARHAQLAVLDLLYIAVAQRTLIRAKKALAVTGQAVRSHKVDPPGEQQGTR
jgi:DNA-binding MurR/RpiR family transcriptional regulator